MSLRLVPPSYPRTPHAQALRTFVWAIRDARKHPALADVRYQDAYRALALRLHLEEAAR